MAFSKVVFLVVFAVFLVSAEVSAHRDLAETTTTPTTYVRGGTPRVVIGGNIGGRRGRIPNCEKNPYSRECYKRSNGGKGGNGEKGGRGAPGPKTEN